MRRIFYVSLMFCLSPVAFAKTETVSVQLNWKAEPQFGGFYAASLSRSDEARGLSLKPRAGGSGTPTVQMLRNKKTDFAIVSADELLISNDRNPESPLIAVFAVFQKNPQMIMCRAEQKFGSMKDVFHSRTILAWQAGLPYAQFLKKKYPKSRIRSVPNTAGIAAYAQKKKTKMCLQGFSTSEPFLATKAGVANTVFLVADEGFNPYTTVLAVRKETLDQKADLVRRVVLTVRGGWLSYLENPTGTNSEMTQLNPSMDLRTMKESADAQEVLIRPSTENVKVGEMSVGRWATLIEQMKELKLIKKSLSPDAQFKNF